MLVGGCSEALQSTAGRELESLRRRGSIDARFLVEWANVKRRIAEKAAECVKRALRDWVKAVYYVDLSGGGLAEDVGRDIDLLVEVEPGSPPTKDPRRYEEMLEKVLSEQLNYSGVTTAPTLFEIHIVHRGGKDMYSRLLRSRTTPLIRIG